MSIAGVSIQPVLFVRPDHIIQAGVRGGKGEGGWEVGYGRARREGKGPSSLLPRVS